MRIVCISDTHSRHKKIKVTDGDILVHAGDMSGRGEEWEIKNFNKWLGELPHKHKIVIAGNHDFYFENLPKTARKLITNAIYLEDEELVIDGIKLYGSPWQPFFYNWAFNIRRGKLFRVWERIPDDVNVLITHGPPYKILDLTEDKREVGCEELLARIDNLKKLKLHIFGHIHEGYGKVKRGNTLFVNASSCNLNYEPINPPIVVNIPVTSR